MCSSKEVHYAQKERNRTSAFGTLATVSFKGQYSTQSGQ